MNKLAMLLLVAGCGTSDPLTWKECAGCAERAGSTWNLVADGAEISGDYDVLGPPDPYICISIGGTPRCSSQQSDSSSPRWSQTLASRIPTADLTSQALSVAIWDQDTGGAFDDNDSICSTSLKITAENLDGGGIRFDCSSRTTAAFIFHNVQ